MRTLRTALAVAALLAASVYISFDSAMGADYPGPPCDICDFAGPPIDALAHGDLNRFFELQPVMGAVSLVLRAPFAAGAELGDGNELLQYRLGSIPCLFIAALVGLWLVGVMRRRGQSRIAQGAVLAVWVASPMTWLAMEWGHPEEVLAAALAVAGVVLAGRNMALPAGIALGLALATKQWAWLAVLPALIALSERRLQMLFAAGGVFALFTAPMLIGDPARFLDQIHHYGVPGNGLTPSNIWWVYGHEGGLDMVGGGYRGAPSYVLPLWLGRISHPLVVLVGIGLAAAYWRTREGRDPMDAVQLVSLIFLVRCLLDPLTYSYHHTPFLLALVAYEGLRRRGLPIVALFACAGMYTTAKHIAPMDDPHLLNRFYLAWALPVGLYLAWSLFAPAQVKLRRRLGESPRRGAAAAAT
jgi:hypothetical protein